MVSSSTRRATVAALMASVSTSERSWSPMYALNVSASTSTGMIAVSTKNRKSLR